METSVLDKLAQHYHGIIIRDSTRQQSAVECRHLYNNDEIADTYSYLYQQVVSKDRKRNFEPTNKMERIPIVRNKIRRLIAEIKPIKLNIYRTDAELHEEIIEAKTNDILDRERNRIALRKQALNIQQQALMAQQQQIAQAQQQQDEQGNPIPLPPDVQQQIASLQGIINEAQAFVESRITHTGEELTQINDRFNKNFKTLSEQHIYMALNFAIQSFNLELLKRDGFEESLVTDQEIYKVHWDGVSEDPVVEKVIPEYFAYPEYNDCKFIHELPYCEYTMMLSPNSVIERYDRDMDEEQIKEVMQHIGNHGGFEHVWVDSNGHSVNSTQNWWKSDHFEVEVNELYFKHQECVYVVYHKEKGVMGDVPKIVEKAEYDKAKKSGKKVDKRYIMKLYEAVFIYNELLYARECATQKREGSNLSNVRLPFIGYCRSNINPMYSLVKETKGLQEMIDMCEWKKKFFVINAKANTTVMDITQKPNQFSLQEWEYFSSLGALYIDPKTNNKFNQWQEIQRGVSNSVNQLTSIQASAMQMIGIVTGVSEAMEAQIQQGDLATNTMQRINQSYMIIQHYILKHEVLWNEVLTEYANYCKLAYRNGKKAVYVIGEEGQQLLNIEQDSIYGDFKVFIKNDVRSAAIVRAAHEYMTMKAQQGSMDMSALLKGLATDDVTKIDEILKASEDLQQKRLQMMEQQKQEGEQALSSQEHQQKMELEQLKQQAEMAIAEMKSNIELQVKQMELALKREELNMKQQEDAVNREVAEKELQARIDMNKLDNESRKFAVTEDAITERAYLKLDAKQAESYLQLQELELQLRQLEIKDMRSGGSIVKTRSMRDKNAIKD